MSNPIDHISDLRTLALKAQDIEHAHGFGNVDIPTDIALIHSELSEALEDYRVGHQANELYFESKEDGTKKPCGIPIEMADVVIRIFGFCVRHDIDLLYAIREKMKYNEGRPYKHGNKVL